MRRYFIHLTNQDFSAHSSDSQGSTWTTDPFDLYANGSYTNYSTTKSSYGNGLALSTWVGLVHRLAIDNDLEDWAGFTLGELSNQTWAQSPTEIITDTGYILNGRYIDTSGQVNVLSWSLNIDSDTPITPVLTFYNTWDSQAVFPGEWAQTGPINVGDELAIMDADRYGVVSLRFNSDSGVTFNFDLKIRVEVDVPVMVPTYQRSLHLFNKFPSWMDMRELGVSGEIQGATPALATPQSLGGKLLNDAAGEWLDDLYAQMTYLYYQRFIDTSDLSQMAWAYQSTNVPQFVFNVKSSSATPVSLSQASDLRDLLEALPTEDVYWWDEASQTVLTNNNYNGIDIDGTLYSQNIFQVWNFLDEIGLQVSLSRLSGEGNSSFANRIKDVFASGLGVGIDEFKKTLRRELDIWSVYGATPSSDYLGATPDILEIKDIEHVLLNPGATPYINPAGLPTQRFKDLVKYLEINFPITWGNFRWDKSVWDPSGPDYKGFHLAPLPADSTSMVDPNYESGIGDGEDLLIYPPNKALSVHNFTGRLVLRGKKATTQTLYTPVKVDFEVFGQASRIFYNNPTTTIWVSLEATLTGDSNTYVASFQMSTTSDADVDKPLGTPSSYFVQDIFNQIGIPNSPIFFLDKATGHPRGSPSLSLIQSLVLKPGQWNSTSHSYTNLPSANTYQLWFSTLVGSPLNFSNQSGPFPTINTQLSTALAVADSSASLNNGTITNPSIVLVDSLWATCFNALSFSGSGGVNCGSNVPTISGIGAAASFTLEAKIQESTQSQSSAICGWAHIDQPPQLRNINGAASIYWTDRNGTVQHLSDPGNLLRNNATHDVAASYDGVTMRLFVDGNVVASAVTGGVKSTNSGDNFWIGSDDNASAFKGTIDEVRLSNVARYTSNYIPSVMPFISDQNTLALYHLDQLITINTQTLSQNPQLILKSTQIHSAPGTWSSIPQEFSITINDNPPYSQPSPTTFPLPTVNWDPYVTGGYQYVIRLTTQQSGVYGAFATKSPDDGSAIGSLSQDAIVFLDSSYILVNGSNHWNVNYQDFLGKPSSVTFSLKNQLLYPFNVKTWELFQAFQTNHFTGIVDENGPWRNGRGIPPGSGNYSLQTFALARSDFGLPDTSDYVVTWMGVEIVDDPQVILWMDFNTVQPAVQDGSNLVYPAGSIREELIATKYRFSPVLVKARLKTSPSPQWYPQIHSGFFYENQEEYYLFAQATPEYITGASPVLTGEPRQGAPIIVYTNEATPRYLRQVSFPIQVQPASPSLPLNYATPSSTTSLSLTNTETVSGTGTNSLYLSYPDVYNVAVTDSQSGVSYSLVSNVATPYNVVTLNTVTDPSRNYNITYTVNNSFWVDNTYEDNTSTQKVQLHFDKTAAQNNVPNYVVWYEHSYLNPATPIPIPLNPFFTTINNGFLYISHDEYNLNYVLVFLSPQKILADGKDQMLVTVHSLDQLENPKPNQSFTLTTNFGTFDHSTITTNDDGFAIAILTAGNSMPIGGATPTISGVLQVTAQNPSNVFTSTKIPFEIVPLITPNYQLLMTVGADQVPADGTSLNVVYGRIKDLNLAGVKASFVRWKRARSLYDLFQMDPQFGIATPVYGSTPVAMYPGVPSTPPYRTNTTYGEVLAGIDGDFVIGPFLAATPDPRPGYWFLSAESKEATPAGSWAPVGDVVFWNEYPSMTAGIDSSSGQVIQPFQMATPVGTFPDYTSGSAFPVTYENANAPATPITPIWLPSIWYAISRYEQYQLGFLGKKPSYIDDKSLGLRNPDWNDM